MNVNVRPSPEITAARPNAGGIIEAVHSSGAHTFTKPSRAFIRLLVGLGVEGEVLENGEGLRLRVPDGESFVPRMFEHLTVGVRNVNVRRPSLDDVFIQYTGRDMRDAEAGAGDQLKANPMVRGFRRG